MSVFKKMTSLLLALVVASAGFLAAAEPTQAASCTKYHTVRGGETLAQIARLYDQTWPVLAEYNNIENPNLIFSGQRICVEAPDMKSAVTPPAREHAKPVFTSQNSIGVTRQAAFGRTIDLYLGNAGIFMPSSNYLGTVELRRMTEHQSTRGLDFVFVQRLLEFTIADNTGRDFNQVFGINYIYFNLDRQQRLAWEDGALSIMHYDDDEGKWVECLATHLVTTKNEPHGRLACVPTQFGVYGLTIDR
jgi:hypothetical protein